ncbi:pyruvate, phosphate dikinase [Croceicoccus sp. BE223]|uniref:pyruvate, phosphate dikinase n=1 Tax=Croceicoccus sp. BE223 TaxID=2817716 RepID=UPI002863E2AE|nr:pyruvate, phosphate dikinase [Croceicoccus sp. BE223]MDR7102363.1 pyruvate,orthophosphate dikinase [Croceicoccus sp. BE223]
MSYEWIVLLDGEGVPSRELVGGKAKSIADMKALGLPVPPAFAITTKACLAYQDGGDMPAGLEAEVDRAMAWLEAEMGRTFGHGDRRLLVSVRSGAAISMPGMMDTVLNLGIDDEGEAALAAETGMADFARDTHRRFVELYSAIVLKQPIEVHAADAPATWREELAGYGTPMPATVREQLSGAIRAVFDSWNTRRAKRYRKHNNIPDDLGTAVTIQSMIFGNLDERSGTGVLFSRNPLTGDTAPYGEYLPRAQGEDVVSGKFTPLPLDAMREMAPAAHARLLEASARLESENRDVQDIEFTVQTGELYLLQSRSAKRAPQAAMRFAVDMVEEGRIDIPTALSRVTAEQASAMLLPRLAADSADAPHLAKGEGACPGAASGVLVADSDEAERLAAEGKPVILVRKTTSPDDVHGMIAARGIVTEQGGSTSHAAVVSRALGRPCVVGTGDGLVARAGEVVTIDGEAGLVFAGELPTVVPSEKDDAYLGRILDWLPETVLSRVLEPGAPGNSAALDLDALLASDAEALGDRVAGAEAVRGQALANPEVVRTALAAGVRHFYASPVLPVALAIYAEERTA